MPVFTVHQPSPRKNEEAAPPERFTFVRDGFYFWAFLLGAAVDAVASAVAGAGDLSRRASAAIERRCCALGVSGRGAVRSSGS